MMKMNLDDEPTNGEDDVVYIILISLFRCASISSTYVQSGASSLAKHGGAYFSAVCGSIQDPIAAPGAYENQEP